MSVILQVDFPSAGPFGKEMSRAFQDLAVSINHEPGMQWKIWTENNETLEAGGIYLFDTKENAEAYLTKHTARLQGLGVRNIRGRIFEINGALSGLNKAPLGN